MGHFQRWLMGLMISVCGTMLLIANLAYTIALILDNSPWLSLGFIFTGVSAMIILWGNYIMEEEKPRGRYRIEQ